MNAENPSTSTSIKTSTIMWIVALFAILVFGGLLIAETTPLIFPTQGSAEAQQIDNLFKFMLAIGGGIFLLVQGVILFSVIRFRATPGDRKTDGINMHGDAMLEFVWTAIPTLIVLAVTVFSFQVWVSITSPKENEQTIIVHGQRFAWSFSYPVPASAIPDDLVLADLPTNLQTSIENDTLELTSNVLHTFVGQPLKMEMITEDSQHAFWIPAMRIKQDLLPGRTTEVRFTPIEPGSYPVVCAELCGSGHGDMRATIVVHPDEATYLSWFNDELNRVLYPPEDPVERGRQILASGTYACSGCHILDDLGWQGVTGPNQSGLGDRVVSSRTAATGLSAEEFISRSLYFPGEYLAPGYANLMPQYQANDPDGPNFMPIEDHIAIVAYLCTQTADGESVCDLENLQQIAETYR